MSVHNNNVLHTSNKSVDKLVMYVHNNNVLHTSKYWPEKLATARCPDIYIYMMICDNPVLC